MPLVRTLSDAGPEVGFEEITTHLLQARFWTASTLFPVGRSLESKVFHASRHLRQRCQKTLERLLARLAAGKSGTPAAHNSGVNPSVETIFGWHTCRFVAFDFAPQSS